MSDMISVGRDPIKLDLTQPSACRPDVYLDRKDVETQTFGKDVCRVVMRDEQTGKEAIFFLGVTVVNGKPKARLHAKSGNGENSAVAGASWLPPVQR